MPAETVVVPVWRFAPESLSVPAPDFVKAPLVAALAPDIVSVVPAAVTSIVPLFDAAIVNFRSVSPLAPVYWRVPLPALPPRTRFAAALLAAPRFPATPPLPIVATLNVPALIVVTPV